MKTFRITLSALILIMICTTEYAQKAVPVLNDADKTALEGIIVEKYHIAGPQDYADTLGGILPKGAVTYRIYVDMKPGYSLQLVYGNSKHELKLQTSTKFYNNKYCGALIGYNVNFIKINKGNYSLDSWITINSATKGHAGILLADDTDGSIITNKADLAERDGLTNANLPWIKPFNINLGFFDNADSASLFSTRNGGWAALSGTAHAGTFGPTADNRVLIAQLTTNGDLSYELNIQLGTPNGGTVQFVTNNPEGNEIAFKNLAGSITKDQKNTGIR
jgi:hypothetical protein